MELDYSVIKVDGNVLPAMQWCMTTYGPPGKRWFCYNQKFYFLQGKDATMFELLWMK
jgi:hypothetical protein